MGKRIIIVQIAIVCLITAHLAHAEAVIEPDNDFYSRYRRECVFLGRVFCAVSRDETIYVMKAPNQNEFVTQMSYGDKIYIEYSCLYNGEYWGITSMYLDNSTQILCGWIKLNELRVMYDYIAFEEEFIDDFYVYVGDYSEIKAAGAAIAWQWPGADAPLWTIEGIDMTYFQVLHAFKDSQSREWGFIPYLYGSPNIWFCLSDPLNRDIPAFNPTPEPTVWVSETIHIDIGKPSYATIAIAAILVALTVVGSGLIIKVYWTPSKR